MEAREWLQVKLPEIHPDSWSRDILCDPRFDETDQAKIITIMWAIWNSRNNITHDKNGYNPTHSIKMIKDDLAILEVPLEHTRFVPGFGWKPPEYDWVKINTNAGIAGEVHKGGAGGIARSPTKFIAA